MRFQLITLLAAATSASAQKVVGTAYGFGVGATGGGSAAAVTPTTNDELAKFLSDDVARTILITKQFDFTGKTATGAGCDRNSCSQKNGGQFYLGDLSCAPSADNRAISSITYDTAGTTALQVGSNKSILGVGGKGVVKGKGLSIKKNAQNVIIQGIHITTVNPGVVWGGDALDMQGGNSKIWVDHCKFSLIGRMFVVSHYDGASATLSNNEFDGVTTTSATCNGNHYWGLMMIGKNEKFTMDKNYFHQMSGRAPKFGQTGVSGTFHAVNNFFENMEGHAFDAYDGANALIEGNVFKRVSQPSTDVAAKVATFVVNAGSACSSALGRSCLDNSVDSTSGKLVGGSTTSFLSTIGKNAVSKPLAVTAVAAHVKSNAGPAGLGAAVAVKQDAPATIPAATKPTQPTTTTKSAAKPTVPAASAGGAKLYSQCGGQGYTGPTKCEAGSSCIVSNAWYSQCLSNSSKFRRALSM
ncbi:pectin lyase fold/virulence factor [Ampelomyces quisqualis]|uniref:pectin lyase n=1 Tax=Ampelomyces quisqualis TaxID=50730 RepID=A0A6A5QL14_AMPQU|nr:pectin lyase fold/virulence factor [Ampelomyces quisqualis]